MAGEKHQYRSSAGTKTWVISTSHFQRERGKKKKSDHEFTATAMWHWPLTQSPSKKHPPPCEIKMSDCQSRWCHWPHLSPISADSCFDQGAGVSLRHCDRDTHPLTSLPIPFRGSHYISVMSPAGRKLKKKRDSSPFLPLKKERSLGQGLLTGIWPLNWWHYVKGNCESPFSRANLVTSIDDLISKFINHRK